MKSLAIYFLQALEFVTLSRCLIQFPKLRIAKFLMELESKRVEARSKDDNLPRSIFESLPREPGNVFFSQCVMERDSRNRELLDQICYGLKPALPKNL